MSNRLWVSILSQLSNNLFLHFVKDVMHMRSAYLCRFLPGLRFLQSHNRMRRWLCGMVLRSLGTVKLVPYKEHRTTSGMHVPGRQPSQNVRPPLTDLLKASRSA